MIERNTILNNLIERLIQFKNKKDICYHDILIFIEDTIDAKLTQDELKFAIKSVENFCNEFKIKIPNKNK